VSAPVTASGWHHFDHSADMGICATGASLEETFTQIALGMTAIVTDAPVRSSEPVPIRCQAPEAELLLIDWLNALIFEMATRRLLFGRFEVDIEATAAGLELSATAWGEPVDPARHQPAVEIKGATYTALSVTEQPDGGWLARCVVDV
jgi:SHS2 domain-containing protein